MLALREENPQQGTGRLPSAAGSSAAEGAAQLRRRHAPSPEVIEQRPQSRGRRVRVQETAEDGNPQGSFLSRDTVLDLRRRLAERRAGVPVEQPFNMQEAARGVDQEIARNAVANTPVAQGGAVIMKAPPPEPGYQHGVGAMLELMDAKATQAKVIYLIGQAQSHIYFFGYTYDYPRIQEALVEAAGAAR